MSTALTRELLQSISDEAYAIDAKVLAASAPNAGKRALINAIVRDNDPDVSAVVDYISSLASVELRIAVINKLNDAIDDKFKPEFDTFLDEKIAAMPKSETSDTELATLRDRRKEIKAQWDALYNVLPFMAPELVTIVDSGEIKVPNKLTMLRGPQGPREINSYEFFLNSEKTDLKQKQIAEAHLPSKVVDGKTEPANARDFRDYGVMVLKAQGVDFDWKKLPDTFSFVLPDGVSFSAKKMSAEAAAAVQASSADDEPDEDEVAA